jgi:hypothetical protein
MYMKRETVPIEVLINTEEWKAKRLPILLLVLISLGLLAGLVFLGKAYTPGSDRVLTWGEWQLLLARRAYSLELGGLQKDMDVLVQLAAQPPDPVKAQIACEQISSRTNTGLASLALQRDAVGAAAQSVQQWAMGSLSKDEVLVSLNAAVQSLTLAAGNMQEGP